MATSRLLPPVLSRTLQQYGTPHVALIAGSLLSYSLCLLVYWVPSVERHLFSVCILSAFMSYSGQCIGYVMLRLSFRTTKRSQFRSPFGIPGAVYSLVVWVGGMVAVAGFQGNGGVEIISFLSIIALLSIIYYSYSRSRQTFSPQENQVLLVAHVSKFNAQRLAAARRARVSHGSGSTRATTTRSSQLERAKASVGSWSASRRGSRLSAVRR